MKKLIKSTTKDCCKHCKFFEDCRYRCHSMPLDLICDEFEEFSSYRGE
jgi:hypothetical protein